MDAYSICVLITLLVGVVAPKGFIRNHKGIIKILLWFLFYELFTFLLILKEGGSVYNLDLSAVFQIISMSLWFSFFKTIIDLKWYNRLFFISISTLIVLIAIFHLNDSYIILEEFGIGHYLPNVTTGSFTTSEFAFIDMIERIFLCLSSGLAIGKLLKGSQPNSRFYPNLLIYFSILLFYAGGFYHGIISYLLYEYDASAGEYTSIVFQVLYYLHYTLFIIAFLWNYLPSFSWPRSSRSLS